MSVEIMHMHMLQVYEVYEEYGVCNNIFLVHFLRLFFFFCFFVLLYFIPASLPPSFSDSLLALEMIASDGEKCNFKQVDLEVKKKKGVC